MARLSAVAANAAADAVCSLLNGGYLRIYDGVQPSSPGVGINGPRLLAELRWNAEAFTRAGGGRSYANAIEGDPGAFQGGEATWFRALTADEIVVFDGSVGTKDADLLLNATTIEQGAAVSVSGFSFTQAVG
jgi:hypothetical protein